ncbi:MAG TPA: dihydrodipicolinate synthase family protein [Tepidisphaeraceae bacterium]|nr:dihydrodipicolinate synthase family protein [Tepidisphaeraceae bacterium]
MTYQKLNGLVAATYTPFDSGGTLNLAAVQKQAEHLLRSGVDAVFIGGTTGESHSLSLEERLALARRWAEVLRGSAMRLVVHVGSNCLADACALAAQAQKLGAAAISALAPSYFKPRSLELLIACCAEIAGAAPQLPFYFYDIPSMTGVQFSMPEFLAAAPGAVPTLAGVKFTNSDLKAYQQCLVAEGGRFDVLWGTDEYLLAALILGGAGAVGSSYNFAAPIYRRMIDALRRGDLNAARAEQYRSVQLIDLLGGFGYMAAAKATMGFLGVDVGPARLPNANLDAAQSARLREALEKLGFFDWVRKQGDFQNQAGSW